MKRAPTGGRGSNQYSTRGRPIPASDIEANQRAREAFEAEQIGWAFQPNPADTTPLPPQPFTVDDCITLAASPTLAKRLAAARSAMCPVSLLDALADDQSMEIKAAVARHPDCPAPTLARIVAAGNARIMGSPVGDANGNGKNAYRLEGIRAMEAALRHPSCPPDVFVEALTPKRPVWDLHPIMRAASTNPSCPPEMLRLIDAQREQFISVNVAGNPSTPPDLLEAMTRRYVDPQWAMQRHACAPAMALRNPSCPEPALRRAARSGTAYRQLAVAWNSGLPRHLWAPAARYALGQIHRRSDFGTWRTPLIARWAATDEPNAEDFRRMILIGDKPTRLAVAANPALPADLFADFDVRPVNVPTVLAALTNPSCPQWFRDRMSTHGNRRIARTASR